jgi:outer membrane murein-binding lipoprotein Lpp
MKNTTLRSLRVAYFFLLLATLALVFSVFLSGCVSVKKYRLLEEDYQNCGKKHRSLEQEVKILRAENSMQRKYIADSSLILLQYRKMLLKKEASDE